MSQPQPSSPGGAFSIDLDRAPQAIRDLEDAAEQLELLKIEAQKLGKIDPPARDQVSLDAAHAISQVAVGGPNSLLKALDDGVLHLRSLSESLRQELQSYRDAESVAVRALDSTPRD